MAAMTSGENRQLKERSIFVLQVAFQDVKMEVNVFPVTLANVPHFFMANSVKSFLYGNLSIAHGAWSARGLGKLELS